MLYINGILWPKRSVYNKVYNNEKNTSNKLKGLLTVPPPKDEMQNYQKQYDSQRSKPSYIKFNGSKIHNVYRYRGVIDIGFHYTYIDVVS